MGNGFLAMDEEGRLLICGIMKKRLEFPVNIKRTDPKMAQLIITQYGGPDGELGASMRYLSQRFAMPYKNVCGVLTDIGTEELAHLEMVCTIVHQLTRDLTPEQVKKFRVWSLLCRSYSRCMATSSKWCTV